MTTVNPQIKVKMLTRLCSLSHPHFIDYIPELLEYASKIGIDTNSEKHLLYIAREGLLAELPNGWKPWFVKLSEESF